MKRFLLKHIGFVITIAVSTVIVLALLVLVLMQNGKRIDAAQRLETQKNNIKRLNDAKPSPARENLEALEADTAKYLEKVEQLHLYFGRPYERALKRFCDTLNIPVEEFRKHFRDYWEKGVAQNLRTEHIYEMFMDSRGIFEEPPEGEEAKELWNYASWREAMNAFVEEARKYTLEEIGEPESRTAQELLLLSLGVPRSFGDNEAICKAYVDSVHAKLIKKFAEGNVGLGDNARNFSFSITGDGRPNKEIMVKLGKVWDIICDLGVRISQSKVYSLEDFSLESLDPTEGNGGFSYYRFQIEVSGTLESIRQLTRDLASAVEDSRFYIIRRMAIMKDFDSAQILIEEHIDKLTGSDDDDENDVVGRYAGNRRFGGTSSYTAASLLRPSSITTRRFDIEGVKNSLRYDESKKFVDEITEVTKEEEKTPPELRRNYARPVIGVGNRCTASIVIDYLVYVTDELVVEE